MLNSIIRGGLDQCQYRGGGYRDALLLKQMPKKQTGFVLLLKQNKSDLVFHHQN